MKLDLNHIYEGDVLKVLRKFPDNSVSCIVTSPPYWALRDYGVAGQLGLEATPEAYVRKMVRIGKEMYRVLAIDGTLWLNLGDSYAAAPKNRTDEQACRKSTLTGSKGTQISCKNQINKVTSALKAKDLVGIPWMVAFAYRKAGWYLRQDIIWSKDVVMPESVSDRCTKSHEYLFLLSKSRLYYYDNVAIQEDAVWDLDGRGTHKRKLRASNAAKVIPNKIVSGIRKIDPTREQTHQPLSPTTVNGKRNKRSVWKVNPQPFPEAHFATFPPALITDCIKAGCPTGGIVLDPFMGAGTTAMVAAKLERNYVGIELNPEYITIAEKRLQRELGLFYKKEYSE